MQANSPLLPPGPRPAASSDSSSDDNVQGQDSARSAETTAPVVLLTTTLRWPIAARLAIAFANLGCRVDAVCPRQHPVTMTRAVRKIYRYATLTPLTSLRAAIRSAKPDFVIPCDDTAATHLLQLYARAGDTSPTQNALRILIARSLGSPAACALATERGRLMALAAEEGVRIPDTAVVAMPGELNAWFHRHRSPAVLKADRTCGGQGVAIVSGIEEAQRAFGCMVSRPPILSVVARTLLERDRSIFLGALKETRRTVTLQDFIVGAPANRAVACWQGQVLAGISVEAIRTQHPTGPATVVRVIDNPEMTEATNRLVRRLGISGLWGVDFVLEASSGAAYLIEVNPRATPICHLPLGSGRNLPAALYARLAGTPSCHMPATIDQHVIAMFPGEWHRNPASPYLHLGYHDIPWDEPALVQECIDRPWSERGWIARLRARVRPKLSTLPTLQKDQVDVRVRLDYAHHQLTLDQSNTLRGLRTRT